MNNTPQSGANIEGSTVMYVEKFFYDELATAISELRAKHEQTEAKWKTERAQKLVLEDALNNLKTDHERVLQMLEVATKTLRQIAGPRKKDGSYFYSIPEIQRMGDDGADTDNARYALEKINKIESLK